MSDSSVPEIRLSNQERDQVIDQLNLAMTDGRIDTAEFEQRSRLVYAAKVPSDLDGVLQGLPVVATTANPPAVGSSSSGKRWFFSLVGDRTQRGDLDLAEQATSISLFGDTTFDLRQVSAPTANLRIFSLFGDVTVMVRPGTRVQPNVFVVLGDRDEVATGPADPDGLVLRLRVVSLFGDVRVQTLEMPA